VSVGLTIWTSELMMFAIFIYSSNPRS